MDPNATVVLIEQLTGEASDCMSSGAYDDAGELLEEAGCAAFDLAEWQRSGGFAPVEWRRAEVIGEYHRQTDRWREHEGYE